MSDVVHNVEYYIIGMSHRWQRIARLTDEYLKLSDPDYEIVDIKNDGGAMEYLFTLSDDFDGDKDAVFDFVKHLTNLVLPD